VILLAPAGELRIVPWAEVDKVEQGKYPPDPASLNAGPAPPLPTEASSPPPLQPGPGTPRVHIEADKRGVYLRRVTWSINDVGFRSSDSKLPFGTAAPAGDLAPSGTMGRPIPQTQPRAVGGSGSTSRGPGAPRYRSATAGGVADPAVPVVSEVVCRAPCDLLIDAQSGQDFFFSGKGIPPSSHFSLSNMSGDITVKVSAGSTSQYTAGIALTVAGGAGALLGALLLPTSFGEDSGSTLTTASGVMIGIGAAMLIPGIILWSTSGTSYAIKPSRRVAGGLRFSNGALVF
jgi:hypothetical protein